MNNMTKYGVMLGSDPELLLNKTVNGITKPFPIIGLIGHGKENPLHIDDSGFRTLQEDNVTLEYTTHPTSTKEEWLKEQSDMYKYAVKTAVKLGLNVCQTNVANAFDLNMLNSEPARTFGCDPTWNAYTDAENPAPPTTGNIRSAGGHVHISYNNPTKEMSLELAKLLDLTYLRHRDGLTGVHDTHRRALYGKAGEIRLKSYGFEWRVPSNIWVHAPSSINKIWRIVEQTFTLYDEGQRVKPSSYNIIKMKINTTTANYAPDSPLFSITTTNMPKQATVKKKGSRKLVAA